jgi:segregation and condensation protein A
MRNQQLQQARQSIPLRLSNFEGPLDLLIQLVDREKMSIRDIQISEITRHYLATLEQFQFDPDTGSDFIYMAAYLLELKSRSLLPRPPRGQLDGEYGDDPRQELINRLLEYKHFRDLAEILDGLCLQNCRVYSRLPSLPQAEDPGLAPMSLDNLFSAYGRALSKLTRESRELPPRGLAVAEQMEVMRSWLQRGSFCFTQVVAGLNLTGIVVTFMAMLELNRLGEVLVSQEQPFGPIIIAPVVRDELWTEN